MRLRIVAIFLACFVLLDIFREAHFLEWTFSKGYLNVSYRIVIEFSLLALIFCIALLFKIKKPGAIVLGLVLFISFLLMATGEIYPIDTTTEP